MTFVLRERRGRRCVLKACCGAETRAKRSVASSKSRRLEGAFLPLPHHSPNANFPSLRHLHACAYRFSTPVTTGPDVARPSRSPCTARLLSSCSLLRIRSLLLRGGPELLSIAQAGARTTQGTASQILGMGWIESKRRGMSSLRIDLRWRGRRWSESFIGA